MKEPRNSYEKLHMTEVRLEVPRVEHGSGKRQVKRARPQMLTSGCTPKDVHPQRVADKSWKSLEGVACPLS